MTPPPSDPAPSSELPPGGPPAPAAPPKPEHPLGFELPPPARVTAARALLFVAAVLALLAAAFLLRWVPKRAARQALEAESTLAEGATPRVQVLAPAVVANDRALVLPGSVQPLEETVVYSRATGYVRQWHVDLGDKVREGHLLAELETPEIDQQLAQARAQLAQAEAGLVQAKANAAFSKVNLERYQRLTPAGLTTQQDLEKQAAQAQIDQASVAVALASIGAQRANLQLLTQLKSFGRVLSPFGGTITARTVERGQLVTAGMTSPLFKIAALDPVRVFVQVPQDVAQSVHVGEGAKVTIREAPGRVFDGTIARAAGALDAVTRTMTTEVRVPNAKGELMTGMYAQVSLSLATPHRVLSVPATALLNDAAGLHVLVVDEGGRIRSAPVTIERDTGATIELASGLAGGERVVKLPSAELTEGLAVEVAP